MSDKVTTTISNIPSAQAPTGPKSARFFICGQTQKGQVNAPVIVTSMAGYEATFGTRTGGAAMWDACQLALRSGASEVVVQRAVGTTPVAATVSLDSGKIVVTAKEVGAFANGWLAGWDVSENTLTITDATASWTETYVGATAAALVLAASYSTRIAVTSSGTLPSGDVTATALASGTDNFDAVSWATQLAKISPDLGPGCVAVPGVAYGTVGQALATHCASTFRHGLLTAASGAAPATLASAGATVAGYTSASHVGLVGPWVKVPDGAGSTRTVDPTPFVAGLRAAAQRVGLGENPAAAEYSRGIVDVTPEYELSSAERATLAAAGVSTVRTVGGYVRLYDYISAAAANPNLRGGQYRDLINGIAFAVDEILEANTNRPGTDVNKSRIVGEISGALSGLSGTYLLPRIAADGKVVHPGYVIEVGTGSNPADNAWVANVAVKCTESIDRFDFVLAVGDASATL